MLYGIDISHHNQYMKDLSDILKYDFIIIKASEGMGFRDGAVKKYMDIIGSSDKPIGFYHFARPEINSDPYKEANNFIQAVKPYMMYKPILALDVEARALDYPLLDGWCLLFCKIVTDILGVKPLIYCSSAETKRFKNCESFGCGLWVAKWGKKPTKKDIAPWSFWALWQDDNRQILSGVRVDTDVFNGSVEQFRKYGEVVTHGEETDTTSDNSEDR